MAATFSITISIETLTDRLEQVDSLQAVGHGRSCTRTVDPLEKDKVVHFTLLFLMLHVQDN